MWRERPNCETSKIVMELKHGVQQQHVTYSGWARIDSRGADERHAA